MSEVLVRYFAAASEAAGAEDEVISAPEDATVRWLRTHLVRTYGLAMSAAIKNGSFLIDGVAASADDVRLGPKVDVLPPFAGG